MRTREEIENELDYTREHKRTTDEQFLRIYFDRSLAVRTKEEIAEDLLHWTAEDSDRNYAFAEHRLQLEVLLDIRDQNQNISVILGNQYVQMRSIALVDFNTKATRE